MSKKKNISIDKLHIDPTNIRPEPNVSEEFIDSVREEGIIHNLVVCPHGDGYGVIVGSRRFTAAKIVGLDELPCVIREDLEDEDEKAMDLSFKENENRGDLPEWVVREHIMRRYRETDARKRQPKRVKEVANRLDVSLRTVQRHVDISENLDSTLIQRLKKPSERSNADRESLERVMSEKSGASSEEEEFDVEEEKIRGFPSLREIPIMVAEPLSRSPFFKKLQKEDRGKAHELATEAVKVGQHRAPNVIRKWEKKMTKSKKKKRVKGGRPTVKLTIEINAATADALDRMIESKRFEGIDDRRIAAIVAIGNFVRNEGFFED